VEGTSRDFDDNGVSSGSRGVDSSAIVGTMASGVVMTNQEWNAAVKALGPPPNNEFWFEEYAPNYQGKCEVCGQSPTVTAVLYGRTVKDVGTCGPCTWGEAKTLDPGCWNDPID
jgi:hypothetical protein